MSGLSVEISVLQFELREMIKEQYLRDLKFRTERNTASLARRGLLNSQLYNGMDGYAAYKAFFNKHYCNDWPNHQAKRLQLGIWEKRLYYFSRCPFAEKDFLAALIHRRIV